MHRDRRSLYRFSGQMPGGVPGEFTGKERRVDTMAELIAFVPSLVAVAGASLGMVAFAGLVLLSVKQ
jgi:hypothetical protein